MQLFIYYSLLTLLEIEVFHRFRVNRLRSRRLGQNPRLEFIFVKQFRQRLELRSVLMVLEGQMSYFAAFTVLDLGKVHVHIPDLILADAVDQSIENATIIVFRLQTAVRTRVQMTEIHARQYIIRNVHNLNDLGQIPELIDLPHRFGAYITVFVSLAIKFFHKIVHRAYQAIHRLATIGFQRGSRMEYRSLAAKIL